MAVRMSTSSELDRSDNKPRVGAAVASTLKWLLLSSDSGRQWRVEGERGKAARIWCPLSSQIQHQSEIVGIGLEVRPRVRWS